MYSTVISGALLGVSAYLVSVEVDAAMGLPSFSMVGSLGSEVRESKERVWSALKNAGLNMPPMHITVNLSPADLKKEGTAFDLPIAVALLEALEFFPQGKAENILFLGELGLNGEIKRVRGVLPIVQEAAKRGIKECIVPRENAAEGAVIPGITMRGVTSIRELLMFLRAKKEDRDLYLAPVQLDVEKIFAARREWEGPDFAEVSGQESAKRAAEIAAAGFHNLLMVGPPGAGKSMIARRIPGIMPPMTIEESLEVTGIYSVSGLLTPDRPLVTSRPFQSPHHTVSQTALIGGGYVPRPGLISLSHRGILFLDELPEFPRFILDSMRQPLEEKQVQITRVYGNLKYPADFTFVGAMNPCPCGYYPDRERCRCTENQIKKYMGRISGPLLDRVDLCVELATVKLDALQGGRSGESSAAIRARVESARLMQKERYKGTTYRFNSDIEAGDMDRFCKLGEKELSCAEELYKQLGLSARAYHRILKVARTIADLAGAEKIGEEHLLEAACYRPAQDYWI